MVAGSETAMIDGDDQCVCDSGMSEKGGELRLFVCLAALCIVAKRCTIGL